MKSAVYTNAAGAEYFFREGCHITEWWNAAADAAVSVARARVTPGATTRWHALAGIAERYIVLEGEGRVEIGTLPPQPVAAGDVVLVPPDTAQRITASGLCDLVFLAVCTPRFEPAAYRDLEATRRGA